MHTHTRLPCSAGTSYFDLKSFPAVATLNGSLPAVLRPLPCLPHPQGQDPAPGSAQVPAHWPHSALPSLRATSSHTAGPAFSPSQMAILHEQGWPSRGPGGHSRCFQKLLYTRQEGWCQGALLPRPPSSSPHQFSSTPAHRPPQRGSIPFGEQREGRHDTGGPGSTRPLPQDGRHFTFI